VVISYPQSSVERKGGRLITPKGRRALTGPPPFLTKFERMESTMSTKEPVNQVLKVYMLRNNAGKFFLWNNEWTSDIQRAKLWRKPGPAKSKRTAFMNDKPENGPMDILEISSTEIKVVTPTTKFVPRIVREYKENLKQLEYYRGNAAAMREDLSKLSHPQSRATLEQDIRRIESSVSSCESVERRLAQKIKEAGVQL
jgi:hypothetical protein